MYQTQVQLRKCMSVVTGCKLIKVYMHDLVNGSQDDPYAMTYPAQHWCIFCPSTFIILEIFGPHKTTSSMLTWKIKREQKN